MTSGAAEPVQSTLWVVFQVDAVVVRIQFAQKGAAGMEVLAFPGSVMQFEGLLFGEMAQGRA